MEKGKSYSSGFLRSNLDAFEANLKKLKVDSDAAGGCWQEFDARRIPNRMGFMVPCDFCSAQEIRVQHLCAFFCPPFLGCSNPLTKEQRASCKGGQGVHCPESGELFGFCSESRRLPICLSTCTW